MAAQNGKTRRQAENMLGRPCAQHLKGEKPRERDKSARRQKTPNKRPKEHGVMESLQKAQNLPIALDFAENYFIKHGKIKYFYKKLQIFDRRGGTSVVCDTFRLWTTH